MGIVDASDFRNRVLEQRDQVTENQYGGSQSEDEESTVGILKEIRDSLKLIEQKIDN